jgi:hypothetical protein
MRVGSFTGPTAPYGPPSPIVHPRDNDVSPDKTIAESDAAKALSDALYEDLQNSLLRDKAAVKTT